MNILTKTTTELLQWVQAVDACPALQIISNNIYKQVINELYKRIHEVPNQAEIVKKWYYLDYINPEGTIAECLAWLKEKDYWDTLFYQL